jgi:RNA recognition motif-containing protein
VYEWGRRDCFQRKKRIEGQQKSSIIAGDNMTTSRLFVGNLDAGTSAETIGKLFETIGTVYARAVVD